MNQIKKTLIVFVLAFIFGAVSILLHSRPDKTSSVVEDNGQNVCEGKTSPCKDSHWVDTSAVQVTMISAATCNTEINNATRNGLRLTLHYRILANKLQNISTIHFQILFSEQLHQIVGLTSTGTTTLYPSGTRDVSTGQVSYELFVNDITQTQLDEMISSEDNVIVNIGLSDKWMIQRALILQAEQKDDTVE